LASANIFLAMWHSWNSKNIFGNNDIFIGSTFAASLGRFNKKLQTCKAFFQTNKRYLFLRRLRNRIGPMYGGQFWVHLEL